MADTGSGFIDFNQYYDANKESEDKMLADAMAEAEANSTDARKKLRHTQVMADGTTDSLSQQGTYNDYLDAKNKAKAAWTKAQALGSDPREAALRQRLLSERGVADKAGADLGELQGRENAVDAQIGEGAVSTTKYKQGIIDRAAADEAAKKARADADAKSKADYAAALKAKAAAYWAAMDKDRKINANPFRLHGRNTLTNGGFPVGWKDQKASREEGNKGDTGDSDNYYTSGWGTDSDAERLDQQLRAAGLTGEADRFSSGGVYNGGKRTSGGW